MFILLQTIGIFLIKIKTSFHSSQISHQVHRIDIVVMGLENINLFICKKIISFNTVNSGSLNMLYFSCRRN